MKFVALVTLLKVFSIGVLGVPLSAVPVQAQVQRSQQLVVAQNLPQLSEIEDLARRWVIRLSSTQEIFYQKNGHFAADPERVLSLYDGKDRDEFEKLDKYYQFMVRETQQVLYIYAVPRSPDLRGYTSGKFLRRSSKNNAPQVEFISNYGCRASRKGAPAEEPIMDDNKVVCSEPTTASNSPNSSPKPSSSPNPVTNAVVNEVRRAVPRLMNGRFK